MHSQCRKPGIKRGKWSSIKTFTQVAVYIFGCFLLFSVLISHLISLMLLGCQLRDAWRLKCCSIWFYRIRKTTRWYVKNQYGVYACVRVGDRVLVSKLQSACTFVRGCEECACAFLCARAYACARVCACASVRVSYVWCVCVCARYWFIFHVF